MAQYRSARERYGSGYVGLLPRVSQRGNRRSKLPELSRKLLTQFIEDDYESLKQKSLFASWAALKKKCDESDVAAPSHVTFNSAVRKRPAFEQTLKRKGRRAAYVHSPFHYELTLTTPRHGDRPFEIGHIDHTELDIELVCSQTGRNLGRPWMTVLTDAFSRRCLAFYLTFDEPSYRSCMMILRDCVLRHHRLPQIIVVDGGPEFNGIYFETLLAQYECTKKTRPPAKARFGSVCERLFGITNTQSFTICSAIRRSCGMSGRSRRATALMGRRYGHSVASTPTCHPFCWRHTTRSSIPPWVRHREMPIWLA
jgi:putative transposase